MAVQIWWLFQVSPPPKCINLWYIYIIWMLVIFEYMYFSLKRVSKFILLILLGAHLLTIILHLVLFFCQPLQIMQLVSFFHLLGCNAPSSCVSWSVPATFSLCVVLWHPQCEPFASQLSLFQIYINWVWVGFPHRSLFYIFSCHQMFRMRLRQLLMKTWAWRGCFLLSKLIQLYQMQF